MKPNKYLKPVKYRVNLQLITDAKISALYFLIKDLVIIYIGQTSDLKTRITFHKCHYQFDYFRFIEGDRLSILKWEKICLQKFKPEVNHLYYDGKNHGKWLRKKNRISKYKDKELV